MEWPPGPGGGGDAHGLTRDVCDVTYAVLLDKAERQALASQQQMAVYRAAGAELTDEEWPSLDSARARLDEVLTAEPEFGSLDARDRELLQLMGVA